MPRREPDVPKPIRRPDGGAVLQIDGIEVELGPFDSPAARRAYSRIIAEWSANGRSLPRSYRADAAPVTVGEVLAAFLVHAKRYYVKNGKPGSELENFRSAVKPVRMLYADVPAKAFGPLALEVCRNKLVETGRIRRSINASVRRIRSVFKWAVSRQMLPSEVLVGLQSLAPLKRGRTTAPEGEPVRPVPEDQLLAVRPFLNRVVRAMADLQVLTGMRSGEVVIMRPANIDRSGPVWLYVPSDHKTSHHGHERLVGIGPKAQEVLKPFLENRKPDAFLFSPIEAEKDRRANATAARVTPLGCGNRVGTNRKKNPRRPPGEHYTNDSYRRAITRACHDACKAMKLERSEWWDWHPHQLRHNAATRLRKLYGIETARVILGHKSADVTEIYAEADREKAVKAMGECG